MVSAARLIGLIIKSVTKRRSLAREISLAVLVSEIMTIGGAFVNFCERAVKPSNTFWLTNK